MHGHETFAGRVVVPHFVDRPEVVLGNKFSQTLKRRNGSAGTCFGIEAVSASPPGVVQISLLARHCIRVRVTGGSALIRNRILLDEPMGRRVIVVGTSYL